MDPTLAHTTMQYTGNTALIWASYNGHSKVVKALVSAPGIGIDVQNNVGINN